MLPFADKTITIYNIVEYQDANNKTRRKFIRSVLTGCTWAKDDKKVLIGNINIESDQFKVKIPQNDNYVSPWEYDGTGFTLKADDVVILGEIEDEIPDNYAVSKLLEQYKERSFTINSVNDYTGARMPLPHYEVTGV